MPNTSSSDYSEMQSRNEKKNEYGVQLRKRNENTSRAACSCESKRWGKARVSAKTKGREGEKAWVNVDITTVRSVWIQYHGWFGFSTTVGLDSVHIALTFRRAWLGLSTFTFQLAWIQYIFSAFRLTGIGFSTLSV